MKTEAFPPLCPFGSEEDAAIFRLPSSQIHVWALTPDNTRFLRVGTYEDGEVSYLIGDLAAMKQDLFDFYHELEKLVEFESGARELFRSWGFVELAEKCGAAA